MVVGGGAVILTTSHLSPITASLRPGAFPYSDVTTHYLRYVTGLEGSGGVNGAIQNSPLKAPVSRLFCAQLFRDLLCNLFWRNHFCAYLQLGTLIGHAALLQKIIQFGQRVRAIE